VVLSEGTIKLGLEKGRMLPRLVQLLLQSFSMDDRVTISFQELSLLLVSLYKVLRKDQKPHQYSVLITARLLRVLKMYLDPLLRATP
jgi:hypothetical protein